MALHSLILNNKQPGFRNTQAIVFMITDARLCIRESLEEMCLRQAEKQKSKQICKQMTSSFYHVKHANVNSSLRKSNAKL